MNKEDFNIEEELLTKCDILKMKMTGCLDFIKEYNADFGIIVRLDKNISSLVLIDSSYDFIQFKIIRVSNGYCCLYIDTSNKNLKIVNGSNKVIGYFTDDFLISKEYSEILIEFLRYSRDKYFIYKGNEYSYTSSNSLEKYKNIFCLGASCWYKDNYKFSFSHHVVSIRVKDKKFECLDIEFSSNMELR